MSELRERIEALPGMSALLPALDGLAPSYLVGGAVRDLLRGADHVDLDVTVEGDARDVARVLAERLGGEAVEHERFGTATVKAPGLSVDLATARRESYSEPGALPDVEPAGLAEDLGRRDFTINAMAAGLSGDDLGVLHDPHGGREDLDGGVVRVLHDRSFVDDPTRLLRAIRYAARLGGRLDDHTEKLARAAIAEGAPSTVSGPRIRDELLDLLRAPEMPTALELMRDLGLDSALDPALRADPDLAASAALATAEVGADRVLAPLATLVMHAPDDAAAWLDGLGLLREQRDRATRAASEAPRIARELDPGWPPSRVWEALHAEPPETLALALALRAPAEPVLRYVSDLRGVRLEINGDDLIAAGIPSSPAIGRALDETLKRKLDGEVAGRDQELDSALGAARSAG